MSQSNALMEEWSGSYGGVPPWDRVKSAHFAEALGSSLAQRHAAVVRIAGNSEPPTFENTIEALERAGRACDRILPVFNVMRLNMSNADYRALDREWQPKLAAATDAILFMPGLFDRIRAVHGGSPPGVTRQRRQRPGLQTSGLPLVDARVSSPGHGHLASSRPGPGSRPGLGRTMQ